MNVKGGSFRIQCLGKVTPYGYAYASDPSEQLQRAHNLPAQVEHKSYPDPWIGLDLLRYAVAIHLVTPQSGVTRRTHDFGWDSRVRVEP